MTNLYSFEDYTHFFEVKLALFDGPIDLLLHLVKTNELPLEKISLAQVADQYMACLDQMGSVDLEVAGEYLVIAATLLSIKSSILLNEPVKLVLDDSGNLVDPHAELLQKLRNAEIYKDGAVKLGERHLLGFDVFAPSGELDEITPLPAPFKDHDPMLLGRAFRKLLERTGVEKEMTISVDSVTIVERMMTIVSFLDREGSVPFYRLIPDMTSRASIISTFIALLELCKRNAIVVRQDESFKEIVIGRSEAEVEMNFSSEFDEQSRASGE